MWPANWTNTDDETRKLLAAWRGANGQTWQYSVGHGSLLVRFYRAGTHTIPGAYLLCKACRTVSFQTDWRDADVKFSVEPGGPGKLYTITDGDRLRVVSGYLFAAESPQLIGLSDQWK